MNSTRFFVYWNGETVGPHAPDEIRAWGIAPETYVCPEGEQEWRFASEYPELVPPVEGQPAEPLPPAPDAAPTPGRKAIFVIHGRGIKLRDAIRKVHDLLSTKIIYARGKRWVAKDHASLARYLLYDFQENLLLAQFDKILVTKLLIAPDFPPKGIPDLENDYQALSEYMVEKKIEYYGAPDAGGRGAVRRWCAKAHEEAIAEAARLLGGAADSHPAFLTLLSDLHAIAPAEPEGAEFDEREFESALAERVRAGGGMPDVAVEAFLEVQRSFEAGGDLDTVASNALYAAYLKARFRLERGEEAVYGRDWDWDFVNYHESFLHLARHRNCDIFIPDFPMDAIPDLDAAARAIAASGSRLVRLDDHHPMNERTYEILEQLVAEGLIDKYVMSGPSEGESQEEEDMTCGADLVHRAFLEGTPYDKAGLAELRRIAHLQDLHLEEEPLAIALSKLIGSKHAKYDMVHELSKVRTYEELRNIMETTGWREKVEAYEQGLARVAPRLEENLVRIDFVVPDEIGGAELSSLAGLRGFLGRMLAKLIGRNPFAEAVAKKYPDKVHKILVTLPPYQTRREHRLNVAGAIEYLKYRYRMDYFWYAWGGSLLSMRRFNDADEALNLSTVAKTIGGPDDGGHASAATCAPPRNASYPRERFGRLNKENFLDYCAYLAGKLEGLGVRIVQVRKLDPKKDAEDLTKEIEAAAAAKKAARAADEAAEEAAIEAAPVEPEVPAEGEAVKEPAGTAA